MTAPRDRFPQPPNFDYVRPEERVPREISCAPPLRVELACALGFVGLVLWAIPDLTLWISSWGFCR